MTRSPPFRVGERRDASSSSFGPPPKNPLSAPSLPSIQRFQTLVAAADTTAAPPPIPLISPLNAGSLAGFHRIRLRFAVNLADFRPGLVINFGQIAGDFADRGLCGDPAAMPRSSRHKSHRSHKHRDRSDSDEELSSKDRKQKGEESAARVSRVPEPEKRKTDLVNGAFGSESGGKKRKEREDSAAVAVAVDRWDGGGDEGLGEVKEAKKEAFEIVELEKSSKSKLSLADSKGRSSKRREGSSERNEESGGKVESGKRRSEKESSRRESGSSGVVYKEVKEKDREAGSEREKKVQESRDERSDDMVSKKQGSKTGKTGNLEEECVANKSIDVTDESRNHELDKALEKHTKRRKDGSSDNDKRQGDCREGDDRRISSREDHLKNESYRDERHKDSKSREKYREDFDREQRHRDDKHRDDRSTRGNYNERADNKHYRDVDKSSESRNKKSKIQDNDHDGSPYIDDYSNKLKENRGRKRSSDGNESHSDGKPRSAKEQRQVVEKNGSSTSKFDSRTDSGRLEYPHSDKGDYNMSSNRPKSSPSSSAYAVKDPSRHSSKPAETMRRESFSEETRRPSAASGGDNATAGVRERVSESRSVEKSKTKDDDMRCDGLVEAAVASHYDRTPRSDPHTSPYILAEKSPPSTGDRRSDRTSARRILDMEEVGQRTANPRSGRESSTTKDKGKESELPLEKPNGDVRSQVEMRNSESISVGSSSFIRTGHLSGSSPGHLPPPPPVRLGIDSPSVLGSYEDENRAHIGDRKSSSRYKRNSDLSMGRGQGSTWKGAPTWPSPIANGYLSLQHAPPPAGFHPGVQQFPGPPLFGVRPSMDLNHTGVSYHVHEAASRFSGHGRPYGWHSSLDDCPPHMQMWDGSNGVYGDESHIYGRPEWDQNRHLMGSRGWEMSADMWKGQNGNANMEFPVHQKELEYPPHAVADDAWVGQSVHYHRDERARSECPPVDISGTKRQNDMPFAKDAVTTPPKNEPKKTPESSKMLIVHETSKEHNDHNARFCCSYLSKLDISLDLAHTELYKQCMSLVEARDTIGAGNVAKDKHLQENKEDLRMPAKRTNNGINFHFPPVTDAIFQRAMSLYMAQTDRKGEGIPSAMLLVRSEERDSPEASDVEKLKAVVDTTSLEDRLPENSHSATNMEEGNNTPPDAEGDNPADTKEEQCDHPSDTGENLCYKISDVLSVEGSEACEALIPECRVNLSRIHLSPESTH